MTGTGVSNYLCGFGIPGTLYLFTLKGFYFQVLGVSCQYTHEIT